MKATITVVVGRHGRQAGWPVALSPASVVAVVAKVKMGWR
jgi:hypothetical protein